MWRRTLRFTGQPDKTTERVQTEEPPAESLKPSLNFQVVYGRDGRCECRPQRFIYKPGLRSRRLPASRAADRRTS